MIEIPIVKCALQMFEHGLQITTDKFGQRIDLFNQIKQLQFLVKVGIIFVLT